MAGGDGRGAEAEAELPGLAALRAAMDDLDAVSLDSLSDDELHEAAVTAELLRGRLGVVCGRFLHRWEGRRVWAADGSRSPSARLARDTKCSPSSAAVVLRRARQQAQMPFTAAAIARGELSVDHLDLFGRANNPKRAELFARDESMLVETCARLRFTPAAPPRSDTGASEPTTRSARTPPPAEEGDHGELWASTTVDGHVVVHGTLDPLGGAAFTTELKHLERHQQLADQHRGVSRTPAERRAAALVEMAVRSATSPAGGRRPRPLFTVLLGDLSLRHLCELANGTVIQPAQLAPWLGVAELETILFDDPLTVLGVSRRRSFTGAVRRAIEVRDRHCRHPAGCDIPASECDVDHIVPHGRGGPTSQFNGRLECSSHNRRHDLHDHDATPYPERPINRLDVLRARLRWRVQHQHDADSTDDIVRSRMQC